MLNSVTIDLADNDQLAALYRELTSTSTSFVQLSSGPALLQVRSLDLAGMTVAWVSANGRHLWHDIMLDGRWRFALGTHADAAMRLGGRDLSLDHAHLLKAGEDNDLLTEGTYATLEITLDPSLVEGLGWASKASQLQRVQRPPLDALRHLCQAAYHSAASRRPSASDTNGWALNWRDLILDQLETALQPWLHPEPAAAGLSSDPRSHRILMQARDYIGSDDRADRASIDDIAAALGVSRRTLFAAFRAELGLGPRRFMELCRLNDLRSRLLKSDPAGSTVTALANDVGFSELGRMAVAYRGLFGESPSETIRRDRRTIQ